MSDCDCGWEGHRMHSNTLRAGKVDGDFLMLPSGAIITHEAFQEWLKNPMGFIPKNQALKDQEKRHAELVGFKDGIIPRRSEVDDDE